MKTIGILALTLLSALFVIIVFIRPSGIEESRIEGEGVTTADSRLDGDDPPLQERARAKRAAVETPDLSLVSTKVLPPSEEDMIARFHALPLSNKVSMYEQLREAPLRMVAVVANELTNSYHGQTLTEQEEKNLIAMVLALGFMARQHESAYGFLKAGCDFEFWRSKRPWRSPSDRWLDTERTFVGYCIIAIGFSGHRSAETDLENVKANMPVRLLERITGPIGDATYHLQRIREVGYSHPMSRRDNDFSEWIQSESGRRFREWESQIRHKAAAK